MSLAVSAVCAKLGSAGSTETCAPPTACVLDPGSVSHGLLRPPSAVRSRLRPSGSNPRSDRKRSTQQIALGRLTSAADEPKRQHGMKAIAIHKGLLGFVALRQLRRDGEPLLFTRDGAPEALVLPLNARLEGQALTQSDAFLKDIDRAEEQISRGDMVPLDKAIHQLGFDDSERDRSSIEVGAPLEDVMTRWFSRGSGVEFTGSYLAGRLVAAEAFDRDASMLPLKSAVARAADDDAADSLARTGVIVSLQSTGKRRTEISVSFPAAVDVSPVRYKSLVSGALGAIKDDVEGSAGGLLHRLPLSIFARGR